MMGKIKCLAGKIVSIGRELVVNGGELTALHETVRLRLVQQAYYPIQKEIIA